MMTEMKGFVASFLSASLLEERLVGKVWAPHDCLKKWGVDWTGPVDFVKAK